MTREDIIRMARIAGCHDNGDEFRFVELRYLERFAALVAAAEQAKFSADLIEYGKAMAAVEREACAKVCDVEAEFCGSNGRKDAVGTLCAAAIRARGQA